MKIYVVGSSKNYFLPLDNIRQKFFIDKKHDGENIDELNPLYCELTALYYMWKHESDDIVGLEHYRRYFWTKNHLLDEFSIYECLENSDLICIKTCYSFKRPPKTWLEKNRKWNDMNKFLSFIKVYIGIDYYNACINHLNGDWHALGNMFISKKDIIDEYCKFIFDLLFNFTKAENLYHRNLQNRILGYFTEFLFGAWMIFNDLKISFQEVKLIR